MIIIQTFTMVHCCRYRYSVQFKMVSMRSEKPIIMRSTPSLGNVPNVAFETVPMFV